MNVENIKTVLKELTVIRPIFHNEKDFQLSFALKLQQMYPHINVRLERRLNVEIPEFINSKGECREVRYFDISLSFNNTTVLLELKYKTNTYSTSIDGEVFDLKSQGAQDWSRFDYLVDIIRIEKAIRKFKSEENNIYGFAIFLTNDSVFWKKSHNETVKDYEFRIPEGKALDSPMNWRNCDSDSSKRNIKDRNFSLNLENTYSCVWNNYTEFQGKNGELKYLLLEI